MTKTLIILPAQLIAHQLKQKSCKEGFQNNHPGLDSSQNHLKVELKLDCITLLRD